jgi:hypothetical protein
LRFVMYFLPDYASAAEERANDSFPASGRSNRHTPENRPAIVRFIFTMALYQN